MTEPYSNAEMMREFQRLIKVVEGLVQELRQEYVRKENYKVASEAVVHRLETVEREADEREKARQGFQRQVMAGALVGLLLLLANIVVSLAKVPGAGA